MERNSTKIAEEAIHGSGSFVDFFILIFFEENLKKNDFLFLTQKWKSLFLIS
jgi:hypothetical protein